jgi:putative ABC transport system permease protein
MTGLLQDLRYAIRQLGRNRSLTVIAIVTLALGIGGNVLVFSLLDAVLLRPLPYSQPDHLFMLFPIDAGSNYSQVSSSYPDFQDWHDQNRTFQSLAAFSQESFNLIGTTEPEAVGALSTTTNLFDVLGVRPLLGRVLDQHDDRYVAVLSHSLWQRRFGGDRNVVGRTIYLDNRAFTIVGVMPPSFRFPPRRFGGDSAPDVFVPLNPNPERGWRYLRVMGRLRPGVTEKQASVDMNGITGRLANAHPGTHWVQRMQLDSIRQFAVSDIRQILLVLLGAVAFVLLIACSNVANLLLSDGIAREHEIAIRLAVGAPRGRILRQLLTKSLLLAAFGGALGIFLACLALPLLASVIPQRTSFFTRIQDAGLHVNSTILIFGALLSLIASLIAGAYPAWKTAQPARSTTTKRSRSMRGALLTIEVALSFVLLAGAGLMIRSLVDLLNTDLGFPTQRLLTMHIPLSETKYSSDGTQTAFYQQAVQRIAALPSVLSAGVVENLPLVPSWGHNGFRIPGPHAVEGLSIYTAVSPQYFRTMGIPLLNGRTFETADTAQSPSVAIINRTLAEKYWPNENPLGKIIEGFRFLGGSSQHIAWRTIQIVGIVGDVRQSSRADTPFPEIFLPYTQRPTADMDLVLRTASDPTSLIPAVKKEIWHMDPDQPIDNIKTMEQLTETDVADRRFVLQLIGAFAAVAILLAGVGIYGVASHWVGRRTQEIGVRMALGAGRRQVVGLVLRQNARGILLGIAVGVAAALAMTRLLAAYLYAVRPTDPVTFAVVGVVEALVALLATWLPARRAAKVDPMVALRYE